MWWPAVQTGERRVLGDATDSGLLRFCDKVIDVDETRKGFETVFVIPFNSSKKWALTMTKIPGAPDYHLILIKGAPEMVIQKCSKYFKGGERIMDDDFKNDMFEAYGGFGTLAERVIGHAFKVRKTSQYVLAGCSGRFSHKQMLLSRISGLWQLQVFACHNTGCG
jgi:sodium/potassium-transporting ATPase subunit alpha